MYKFTVTMSSYEDVAREFLKGSSLLFWRVKIKAFLSVLPNKIYNRAVKDNPETLFKKDFDQPYSKILMEFNEDKGTLEERKKDLEDFLYNDYKQYLKDNEDVNKILNHRIIKAINRVGAKLAKKLKLEKKLAENVEGVALINFLNRIGITVTMEISKE